MNGPVEGEIVDPRAAARDVVTRAMGGPPALPALRGKVTQYAVARNPDEWLSQAARDLIMEGVPRNRDITYRSRWKFWIGFCASTKRQHLPAVEESVVMFIESCKQRTGRYGRPWSPNTVRLCLDVIAVAHRDAYRPERDEHGRRLQGYASPTRGKKVKTAMLGYRTWYRNLGHRPDKAHAFSMDEVEAMIGACDTRSPYGLLHALVIALCVDAGFRRSEVVAINWDDLRLTVADPAKVAGGEDYLLIHVPFSKTDQAGHGDEVVLYAHPAESSSTCPVRLAMMWRRLFRERGLELKGPFLRSVLSPGSAPKDDAPRKGKITQGRMPAAALETIVRRVAAAAEVNVVPEGERAKHIAPHGLRAAGVTIASEVEGASTAAIYRHFRFSIKSPVGLNYMRSGAKKSQNPMRAAWSRRQIRSAP